MKALQNLLDPDHMCCCYHCMRTFEAQDITRWLDDGDMAMCPLCSVDSVLLELPQPVVLLQRHRAAFGHIPKASDLPRLRRIQQLSECWLVSPDAITQDELLEAIQAYAELVAVLIAMNEEPAMMLGFTLMKVDQELHRFRERFQAVAPAARIEAWRASMLEEERMPGWCNPGLDPG